jgi:hypothetical protein
MRAIERRLRRLERRRRLAEQRDPAEVCDLVLQWYNDKDNVTLPEFTGEEKVIADAMAHMLHISDLDNQWDYSKSLPLELPEFRD